MPYKNPERQRNYQREHYAKNKESYRDRARKQRLRMIEFQQSYKNRPCTDCGKKYPYYVMDFDHVRGKKRAIIAQVFRFGSKKELLKEIRKWEVVCSNCHRERTHQRI